MKKFGLFIFLICALTGPFVTQSDAAIKITVKNNRNHTLTLAFRWAGFDSPDDRRSGWYSVKAGESKTITLKKATYALTAQDFGYYATGGGKVWKGSAKDKRPLKTVIHPKKAFSGHPEDPINGGVTVYFRHIKLKETGNTREDGSATLTFNP